MRAPAASAAHSLRSPREKKWVSRSDRSEFAETAAGLLQGDALPQTSRIADDVLGRHKSIRRVRRAFFASAARKKWVSRSDRSEFAEIAAGLLRRMYYFKQVESWIMYWEGIKALAASAAPSLRSPREKVAVFTPRF